jgi:translation initiation factor IF-1
MSNKDDLIEMEGSIIEVLPNQMFKVQLENQHAITCYTAGRLKKFKIRLVTGDSVNVEMSIYDLSKGRITYRN